MSAPGVGLLTGVVGFPIAHSLSPVIHNSWRARHGVRGVYAPFNVAPKDFPDFLCFAPRLGLSGLNVTTPHKEAAFASAGERSETAERAGSVNTLSISEAGDIVGHSTDGEGFLRNLEQAAGWTPQDRAVALFGAGGAARAVAAALLDAGASVVVVNRTEAKAEALAAALGGSVRAAPMTALDAAFAEADLLVNATTLGMEGKGAAAWALPPLKSGAVATDLIYAPLVTPFLEAAAARGAATVDGLGMLLHQAVPGFKAWHGVRPTVDDALRAKALSALERRA